MLRSSESFGAMSAVEFACREASKLRELLSRPNIVKLVVKELQMERSVNLARNSHNVHVELENRLE
jgi:hypothetical protein